MTARTIIAIDGPAASGKSTAARALAARLGLPFLDTGAMYRAVTLAVLRRGVDPADAEGCERVAGSLTLDFDAAGRVLLDGEPGEPHVRSPEVTRAVSSVAAHPGVRRAIVPLQRAVAAARGAVAEGRDTTTVVFPDAAHKFYLAASASERARRRAAEEGRPEAVEAYREELERRDALDSSRAESPLVQAADAIRIETDGLSPDEVFERLLARVEGRPAPGAGAVRARRSSTAAGSAPVTTRGLTYRSIMVGVHLLYTLVWPARVRGREHVPEGGVLIVSNHQSFLDIPLLAKALAGRHVAFVARDSLARSRLLAWVMRRCGAILISRGRPDAAAVRETIAHLDGGDAVVIFPEGTRTRDGTLGSFKRGALLAARRAGTPVVPCAVSGSFRAWPVGRRWPRPGGVRVAFGPPVDPSGGGAQDQVRQSVERLLGESTERHGGR